MHLSQLTAKDRRYIDEAYTLATSLGRKRYYFGALIAIRNRVIAYGVNCTFKDMIPPKSHPFQKMYGKNDDAIYPHAETDALKNALRRLNDDASLLKKATLYVSGAKNQTQHGPLVHRTSKPCKFCMTAISTLQVRRIVYTIDNENVGILMRKDGEYYVLES